MDKKKNYFRRNWYKMLIVLIILVALIYVAFFWGNIELKKRLPIKYEQQVTAYAEQYSLDKYLVYSVICAESSFRPDVTSSAGAVGLMQLMPSTATWLNEKYALGLSEIELTDPDTNIRLGCCYLAYLSQRFDNNISLMLAAYNGGEGNVTKWLKNTEYSADGKNLDIIPYEETANYVKKVSTYYDIYKKLYS